MQARRVSWAQVAHSRLNAHYFTLVALVVAFVVVGAGLIAWCGILTPALPRSRTNKGDISDLQKLIDELTANITAVNDTVADNEDAVVSKVMLTPSGTIVPPGANVPLDNIIYDPFGLYDLVNYRWIADRDGLFEFSACISFDLGSTPGFPTATGFDLQLQVFQDGSISTEGLFLNVYTALGSAVGPFTQRAVCGINVYNMTLNSTLELRTQTRIIPVTIVNSSIDGGVFASTRGYLRYLGAL